MGRIVHEKRLRGVHPQLVLVPKAWGVQLPFDVLITEGVRMDVRQRALYAQGRSTPGQIVTMAETAALTAHGRRLFPGGDIFGCAFDAVPCTGPVGQPNYNDAPAFERMGAIAERMGLVWGGRWATFPDKPHVQLPDWRKYQPVGDEVPDYSDVTGGSSTA